MYLDELRLLEIREVSQLTGIKQSFLRRLVFQKRIPFFKIGRKVMFSRIEIDNWLNAQRQVLLNNEIGGQND